MTDIQLNLINKSNDTNNSEILIFSKNVTPSNNEIAVAWKVIKNLGVGDNHPFVYPYRSYIGASDSYGNYTPRMLAENGQEFEVVLQSSGDVLQYKGNASSPNEISLLNNLDRGAINAFIFKAGSIYAKKTAVSPQEKAVFEFKPVIWIGVASEVEEGQVIASAIISSVNTEISLLGIASADIVMTGGGSGPNATPFKFTLENVVNA